MRKKTPKNITNIYVTGSIIDPEKFQAALGKYLSKYPKSYERALEKAKNMYEDLGGEPQKVMTLLALAEYLMKEKNCLYD